MTATGRGPTASDGGPAGTFGSVFDGSTDLVVVLGDDASILYANPFAEELLSLDRGSAVGRNIAEFVHGDDLVRAIEVSSLIASDELGVPVTPAYYRLLRDDGTTLPVEINGSPVTVDGHEAPILIVGRYSGDRHLQDQITELLVDGSRIDEAIELVPRFGEWRHPDDLYAVLYRAVDGSVRRAGTPDAVALIDRFQGRADTPWALAIRDGVDRPVAFDDLPAPLRDAARSHDLTSCWAVPVDDPARPERAAVLAWSSRRGATLSAHRYSLDVMVRSLDLIFEWRHQRTELEAAARTDALTGVVNRSGFFESLRAALADPDPTGSVAVLYVDLDRFKAINDEHGHATGDLVLTEVARRLVAAGDAGHVVARLGGDEFAVVCATVGGAPELGLLAERMIDAVSRPIELGGGSVAVGLSVGIGVARPGAVDADTLVAMADAALYDAKSQGGGCHRVSPRTLRRR